MRPSSFRVVPAGVRASDAERDEAIGELRHRFAEGRLSQETFLYRMDAALRAKDHAELSDLFVDLPAEVPGPRRARRILGPGGMARESLAWLRRAGQRISFPGPPAIPASYGDAPYGPASPQPLAPPQSLSPPQPLCLPRQEGDKFTIGRAPSCDFTVADLSVSRWHARLHKADHSWMLSDLGSTNGTRLNGWRVTKGVEVRPGDQVSFGTVTYVITDGPAA